MSDFKRYKISIIIVLVLAVIIKSGINYHHHLVKEYKEEVTNVVIDDIEQRHNQLIHNQLIAHQKAQRDAVIRHERQMTIVQKKRDEYWKNYYASRGIIETNDSTGDTIQKDINDEADDIDDTDTISDDTFRLLNKARSQVVLPEFTRDKPTRNPETTANRQGIDGSMLQRPSGYPVGNNQRS